MVHASIATEAKATALPKLQIFQRRGVAVHVGATGVALTPAVAAIITATEKPFRAPVSINN